MFRYRQDVSVSVSLAVSESVSVSVGRVALVRRRCGWRGRAAGQRSPCAASAAARGPAPCWA